MTAADFRAALAKHQVRRYEAAAACQMNPQRFSLMLNGRIAFSPALAKRLRVYLQMLDELSAPRLAGIT